MPSDTEDANGSELRRVLEERNLYAISTFTPNNQATWWSGRAQHHGRRIEYIAVNDEWKDLSAKPSTLPAVQMPGEAIDHVSVRASTLWPQFCPDGAKHDVVENGTLVVDSRPQSNAEAQRWFQHHTSACSPKLFSLAQRGLIDEMYSTAHSTCHQCASFCFGLQKSAPKPKKPWTSQQTVAMSIWKGTARHQLHKQRLILKRADKKACSGGLNEPCRSIRRGQCTRSNERTLPAKGAKACASR